MAAQWHEDALKLGIEDESRVTLTFAPMEGYGLSAEKLASMFAPESVFVKISYLDPNPCTKRNSINPMGESDVQKFVEGIRRYGFSFAYRNGDNCYRR
ncbi:MAG: hypothetical protein ABIB71_08650 [Candidatus Woesearchaeota archaeon]